MTKQPNRIKVLPDSLVNVIAAGEVVERPASVVKELIENSLDAGASRIAVRLGGGGRDLIVVTDDGLGMPPDDAILSVERHATSKIGSVQDLTALGTLGFRGEALPSIAATGRFVLETWDGSSEAGTRLVMDFGALSSVEPCPRARGTTVSVTGLFSRLPARRKFLRSAETERAWCLRVIEEAALSRPEVHFEAADETGTVLLFARAAGLRERVSALWGPEETRSLLRLADEGQKVRLEGYLSPPGQTYPRRVRHHVLVNGRPVRDAGLNRLIQDALSGAYPPGRYPALVLSLRFAPGEVDVNVHPAKREIRLRDPRLLSESLRRALSAASAAATSSSARASASAPQPDRWPAGVRHEAQGLPASDGALGLPYGSPPHGPAGREDDAPLPLSREPSVLGKVLGTYILAAADDGVVIVDQHAAHERIVYNRLMTAFASEARPSQRLLVPVLVSLGPSEAANLARLRPSLERFGFALEDFGAGTVRLAALPAEIEADSAEDLVRGLAGDLDGRGAQAQDLALFISRWACRASVMAGRPLSRPEMEALLADLARAEAGFACPHGRPTLVRLDRAELERLFTRR